MGECEGISDAEPMPKDMNWDVWAGTAPKHNYSSRFDKGNWRGWYDWQRCLW